MGVTHVGFESQLLLALRAERAVPTQALVRLAHRAFFTCTAAAVWFTHRRLLRRAHHDASGFLRACRAHYAFHLDAVDVNLGVT